MSELVILEHIWYMVVSIAVVFYAVLDGFDLGVGMLHPFVKGDRDRRIMLNAIGPVWDGNEVWLVIVGGALFAGFPLAYSVFCSAFYTPIMMLLMGLMIRAVAIEFRSKVEDPRWRSAWDIAFGVSSFLISLLVGVALGNLAIGIPLTKDHEFIGNFFTFLTPYPIIIGVTGVALFLMHGNIFLLMKTEGALHEKLRTFVPKTLSFFIAMYFIATLVTLVYQPHMTMLMREYPILFVVALLALVAVFATYKLVHRGSDGYAFISSCITIFLLFSIFALGIYPNIIPSTIDPAASITLYNAASSAYTLWVVLAIAIIGIPLVLAYGYWIYRIFRGKVRLDHASY